MEVGVANSNNRRTRRTPPCRGRRRDYLALFFPCVRGRVKFIGSCELPTATTDTPEPRRANSDTETRNDDPKATRKCRRVVPHSFQNLDDEVAELVVIFPSNVWEYVVLDHFPFAAPEAEALAEEARRSKAPSQEK